MVESNMNELQSNLFFFFSFNLLSETSGGIFYESSLVHYYVKRSFHGYGQQLHPKLFFSYHFLLLLVFSISDSMSMSLQKSPSPALFQWKM